MFWVRCEELVTLVRPKHTLNKMQKVRDISNYI